MNDVLVVVQARMGSTRLPGKVLAELGGQPLLRFLLGRLEQAPVDAIVVATSDTTADDPVAALARSCGVGVVRGSESDVLARYAMALREHPARTVVRLTADCPLTDRSVIAAALEAHEREAADYTSNTLVRTYPDGLDVEVISAVALATAHEEATAPAEREHVTPFVYRRPERFRLAAFRHDPDYGDERWTVDTAEDLEFLRRLVDAIGRSDFPWQEALPFATARRPLAPATQLLPAADSTPAERRWDLVTPDGRVGAVSVSVESGVGRVRFDVPPSLHSLSEELLARRLAADAQVVELIRV